MSEASLLKILNETIKVAQPSPHVTFFQVLQEKTATTTLMTVPVMNATMEEHV